MAEKKITLAVGGEELNFAVTIENYNRYVNELKVDDKVSPSLRFVRRSLADPEQREKLDGLCDSGLAIDIAGALVEEFRPKVEIEVKK
ncbi:MAG: hypothetical protein HP002_12035 [Lentisphaeria bacterium]|uniref:putative phage tail assembly chaperone n=1 Tax=uncultured Victivallis sp. TaxID=354118 RepID=UPI001DAE3A67|nr:putative phage tail assembly chaperone [uncultured Victivallis sp.]MBS1454099.1 hypothetical protein [Lentisphaeria bacterium]MBS5532455.1 hypothetical protein [bacterium]DAG12570.1 MAG TPA: tail assembly chaperone protein [Caudoviricetes sp.]